MENIDKEINTIIMQELGLEIGDRQRIYDQDTGNSISINGMQLIAPNYYAGKDTIEFDPYNSRRIMGPLFEYFLDKYSDETGVNSIAYYSIPDEKGTSRIECKFDDDTVIRSNSYRKDSLKYTDIIMQLNGESNVDLQKYDKQKESKTIKKAKRKKSTPKLIDPLIYNEK